MANNYSDLRLIHINSDGSDGPEIGFTDVAWSVENAPGATLTGTATIPEDFPDGTARLAVRASRLSVPPGLDTSNQELDTDGDGFSNASEDTQVDFPTPLTLFPVGSHKPFVFGHIAGNAQELTFGPADLALAHSQIQSAAKRGGGKSEKMNPKLQIGL